MLMRKRCGSADRDGHRRGCGSIGRGFGGGVQHKSAEKQGNDTDGHDQPDMTARSIMRGRLAVEAEGMNAIVRMKTRDACHDSLH